MFTRLLLIAGLLAAPACFASQLYTLTGTFSSGAPDTELLTPSVAFSASFSLNDPPAVYNFSSNQTGVSVALTYVLDGSTLSTYSPIATLWTSGAGGGFSLVFFESNGINRVRLDMSGPQMFTGPTNAPTGLVLPIEFTNTSGSWSYHNLDGSIITGGSFSNASVNTVPEPSTVLMLICGAGVLVARRRWRGILTNRV